MKKQIIFVLSAMLVLAVALIAASAATVSINPSSPSNNDNLVCSVSGNSEALEYSWYRNGQEYKTEIGITSQILASETVPGDTWACQVYRPDNGERIGEASAIISPPQGNSGSIIIISPSQPLDNEDLRCYTETSENLEYYWYKNGQEFKSEYARESVVNSGDTNAGDNWQCIAYRPDNGERIGEAGVVIDITISGSLRIIPSNPYTTDSLRGYIDSSSSTVKFVWSRDLSRYKEDAGTETNIDASETKKHEVWTLKAYTPLYERFIGETGVEILNSLPVISAINAPDTTGENTIINMGFSAEDADNDRLSYSIYRDGNLVSSSNSFSWFSGSAGAYNFTFIADDGEGRTLASKTVTVGTGGGGGGSTGETRVSTVVRIRELEFSPVDNAVKIRNKGRSLRNLRVSITFPDIGANEGYKLNLAKNEVVYKLIETALQKNVTYLAKVDISSNSFKDTGYILVKG